MSLPSPRRLAQRPTRHRSQAAPDEPGPLEPGPLDRGHPDSAPLHHAGAERERVDRPSRRHRRRGPVDRRPVHRWPDHRWPINRWPVHRGTVRTAERDEGTVTAFAVILTSALLACIGLVVDGGLALTAKVRAVGLAQEAARSGAQDIDLTAYRANGRLALRQDAAIADARAFLTRAGATGTATATLDSVTVTVDTEQPTTLLRLVGITTLRVSAHATARALTDAGAVP